MSDDRISTVLDTARGTLTFQEYFVRERHQIEVHRVRFVGAHRAHPAPGVIESIEAAATVIFAPSNPVTSIGPILAVPGVRDALRQTKAPIAAVSPDRWRSGGLRPGRRADEEDGLAEYDRRSGQSVRGFLGCTDRRPRRPGGRFHDGHSGLSRPLYQHDHALARRQAGAGAVYSGCLCHEMASRPLRYFGSGF